MNRVLTRLYTFALCLSTVSAYTMERDNINFGFPFFSHRPQNINTARRIAGEAYHLYLYDVDQGVNGTYDIAVEYTRSFDRNKLGEFIFFNGTDTMSFGDPEFGPVDFQGINFLLADDYRGSVKTLPRIENIIIDIGLRLGFDEWVEGLYLQLYAPINWTRWNLDLEETIVNKGTTIAANSVGNVVSQQAPVHSIVEGWKENVTFADVKQAGMFAKIDPDSTPEGQNGARTRTRLADVEIALGYNFVRRDWVHFGANIRVIAPTGNRPDGEFFFEPVAGTGKLVGLGGGVEGHFDIWTDDCDQVFSIWYVGNGYHFFRSKQKRTFDLIENGIGSRYLLFKKFNQQGQYIDQIVRGPDVTTIDVRVRIDFEADASVMFDYKRGGMTFDVGYNIWGRTQEKISPTTEIQPNTFGIKGNTQTGDTPSRNLTASQSRINGENADSFDARPVFISTADLDIERAENPSAISHKVFAHLGYTWENCDVQPFLGAGGEAEFSGRKNRALDQWGVWVKFGFSFL